MKSEVPLHGRVVGHHHAEASLDQSHPRHDASGVDFLLAVELMSGEGGELEEGRAGVEQLLDAFADWEFAFLVEFVEHLLVGLEGGLRGSGRTFLRMLRKLPLTSSISALFLMVASSWRFSGYSSTDGW